VIESIRALPGLWKAVI